MDSDRAAVKAALATIRKHSVPMRRRHLNAELDIMRDVLALCPRSVRVAYSAYIHAGLVLTEEDKADAIKYGFGPWWEHGQG